MTNRIRRSMNKPTQERNAHRIDCLQDEESLAFELATSAKPRHPDPIGSSPVEEKIDLKVPSDLKYLDSVLNYLNERILRFGIVNAGDVETLIALDEAIVNAIKHGNKCDPQKSVHIVAEFNSEGARFKVTDEGEGFNRDEVPDPTAPSRLLEPCGRGLLLINRLMDEVSYNRRGNQLEMYKRATGDLSAPGSGKPGE